MVCTCDSRQHEGQGEVGVEQHHGVVDLPVQGAAVGVHHVHLAPQVVPVLPPAVVLLQPGKISICKGFPAGALSGNTPFKCRPKSHHGHEFSSRPCQEM